MMSKVLLLVAIITSPIGCRSPNQPPPKEVNLDVFYTSGCDPAAHLFKDELEPKWEILSTFVNLRLIPFGTNDAVYKKNKRGKFRCFQPTDNATEEEEKNLNICKNNIAHACGINSTPNLTIQVKYVSCLLNYKKVVDRCSQEAGLDYNTIKQCEDGEEGIKLLNQHGKETLNKNEHRVHSKCQPFIVYSNDAFNHTKLVNKQEDIRFKACEYAPTGTPACKEKVTLDVYYSAFFQLSTIFFQELFEKWALLSTFFNIRLIPFGLANNQSSNGYNFTCHYGSEECKGNIIHACGFKLTLDQSIQLKYAHCLMEKNTDKKISEDVIECSKLAGLNHTLIENCVNNLEGKDLLRQYGDETLKLEPKVTDVPLLIFDKTIRPTMPYNGENIKVFACRYLPADSLPCFSKSN